MSEVLNQTAPPAASKKAMHPKKKKALRTALAAAVIAGLLGAGGYGFYRFLNGTDAAEEIYSQSAVIGSIQSKVSGSGTAMAKESAAITLTQGGIVQEVFVTAGDVVTAGQPL